MKARVLCALLAVAATTVAIDPPVARAAVEDDLRDGDRFFEDGQWARAAAAFDRAIAKAPGQVTAEAYGKRAAIYIIVRDYAGGLAFVARVKVRLPSAPELLEQEALLLWETGKRDAAVAVAERVVAIRPQTFSNQNLIGEYFTREPARVVTAYEAYLAARPAELESGDVLPRVRLGFAYVALARTAIAAGDTARAAAQYAAAVTQFETLQRRHAKRPHASVNAVNGLCAAYTGLGRFDQAVTTCEQATRGRTVEPSVWFNLGTAYLARKQSRKAREAGATFVKLRGAEARGFILLGDTHFAERDWRGAIEQYLRAEKLIRGTQVHESAGLSIRLGKTYRRLPAPPTGPSPNLALAIDKLSAAHATAPQNAEVALELGAAYLEAAQDAKATALADRLLAAPDIVPATRAALLVLAGKAQFNRRQLREARQRFEAAGQLRPADITIQRALVSTINELAFESTSEASGNDLKAAGALLDQALAIAPKSPVTVTNLAVLALERDDCDGARRQLDKLATLQGHDPVARTRLFARSYLCGTPDAKRAAEAYAVAEREARKANAALALAEIYTEWAPLTWDADLATAISRLEAAVQSSTQDATVAAAAKRNLAIALWKRGWRTMRDGRAAEAATDFERALREPSLLRGTEPLAFELSYALALLDANRPGEAVKLFRGLATKGNGASYLRPPFAKLGAQFFATYASYRTGTLQARVAAATAIGKHEQDGPVIRALLAAAWEGIAHEQWRTGQPAAAQKSLALAEKYGGAEVDRRVSVGRAVLGLARHPRDQLATLEALAGNPGEALVNLGIVYEQLGRPRDAYDAWQRARAKGVQTRDLQKWIDTKKRIYGY